MIQGDNHKEIFLSYLTALEAYIEGGMHDYLHDNSVTDYLTHGNMDEDLDNLRACLRIRAFVTDDNYPWGRDYKEETPHA